MIFDSPLWLLGLMPWVAVVVFILPGRFTSQSVPFLQFWESEKFLKGYRSRRMPPGWVVLVLIALLLAVLAAANPTQIRGGTDVESVKTLQGSAGGSASFVAITAIGARSWPVPQVMVRLANQSDRKSIRLKIISQSKTVEETVALQPKGSSENVFVDIPGLKGTVSAEIDSDPGKNPLARATAVCRNLRVPVVVDAGLPQCVQRVAEVYGHKGSGSINDRSILISNEALDSAQPGIWIAHSSAGRPIPGGSFKVTSHAITQNVTEWPVGEGSRAPAGFSAEVSCDNEVIVAFRETPCRQIFLNADLSDWAKTTDFVIFFENAFDWLGDGDRSNLSEENWSRVNLGSDLPEKLNYEPVGKSGGPAGLSRVARLSLKGPLIDAALACLIIAAWKGSSKRIKSAK